MPRLSDVAVQTGEHARRKRENLGSSKNVRLVCKR